MSLYLGWQNQSFASRLVNIKVIYFSVLPIGRTVLLDIPYVTLAMALRISYGYLQGSR